jgi:hypothetical protein
VQKLVQIFGPLLTRFAPDAGALVFSFSVRR